MDKRTLGKTGIEVSALGLGGLFTSSLGPGFEESRLAVRRAVELGINYFDTAPAYADSEEILGRIMGDGRKDGWCPPSQSYGAASKTPALQGLDKNVSIVLSTKLGGRPRPFDPRNKAQLMGSVKESLRLLHREVIDILFVHEPDRPGQYDWWNDPESAYGPVIEVMDQLKKEGVIRFTGLGGTTMAEMAHLMRSDRFDVVLTAFNYSALYREAAIEVLPEARARKMGVVLGSVLQQGGLARRYDEVVRAKPAWLSKPRQEQLLAFYRLLDESGLSIVELGLRFAVSCPDAHSVLIGPKTAKQVEESVRAVERGPLPADVRKRLDEIAALVPFRPFEEPIILPFSRPRDYYGPGVTNVGAGAKVGRL